MRTKHFDEVRQEWALENWRTHKDKRQTPLRKTGVKFNAIHVSHNT
jgi:hypothetical protein